MRKSPKFSPEVIECAVRMVFDAKNQNPSQWAAIEAEDGAKYFKCCPTRLESLPIPTMWQ